MPVLITQKANNATKQLQMQEEKENPYYATPLVITGWVKKRDSKMQQGKNPQLQTATMENQKKTSKDWQMWEQKVVNKLQQ